MDSAATSHTNTRVDQTWNTEAYAANGRFVATLAADVVTLLAPQPGEHILDLGCGDGALTERIAAMGALMTGADASAVMVDAARTLGPPESTMPIPHASPLPPTTIGIAWPTRRQEPCAVARSYRCNRPSTVSQLDVVTTTI